MSVQKGHTDIIDKGWIAHIPLVLRPYFYLMRLDRPIGTWLLLLPGWWAILWASGGLSGLSDPLTIKAVVLFGIGAVIMRGAGCVINDLWDRDLDKVVERTKGRPLASGQVSVRQAMIFLSLLMALGLLILLQFNRTAIIIGCCSLAFIVIYPLMKRVTWWPQAFLGLTFNFGALIGWAAMTGEIGWQAWALYIGGFFWTMGYDTIYAIQDMEDDALAGIKSTARLFEHSLKTWLVFFYLVLSLILSAAFIYYTGFDPRLAVLALPFTHLIWQIRTLDKTDPANALWRFKSNRDFGLLVCISIIVLS